MKLKIIIAASLMIVLAGCGELMNVMQSTGTLPLTEADVVSGLKEALVTGARNSASKLGAENGYFGKVGKHYAGPTWESNSGSKVIGRKTKDCMPDPTAIPWLLLEAVSNDGPGIFGNIAYIKRVNTAGGLKPSSPGAGIGEVRRVPYTAEYYFYGKEIE
jgi:hypothetical protein